MRFLFRRNARLFIVSALVFIGIGVHATPGITGSRDVLWESVTDCLDLTAMDYCGQCRMPRIEKACAADSACGKTLEVWSESSNYVVIRDRKMCDCPPGFVHGLAVPRARVTGVEDLRRPNAIWSFAWDAGRKRIDDLSTIALVVNPAASRSQDQLHVHIVRLKKDARQRFESLPSVRVQSLDEVWSAAAKLAATTSLDDYGVLVVAHQDGGYLVLVDQESLERKYTEAVCR